MATVISAFINSEVVALSKPNDALKLFLENPEDVALIMVDFDSKDSESLIKSVLNRDKAIPCIITADEQRLSLARKTYKTQTLLDYFYHYENSEILWKKIERMVTLGSRKNHQKKYCRVNLSFFFSTKEVFCDVYLKISDDKFVKILNRYQEVDFHDLKKYEQRRIKYLYVRERDFSLITKKLVQSIRPMADRLSWW